MNAFSFADYPALKGIVRAANRDLGTHNHAPLTADQLDCLTDYEREEEAHDMVDDLNARCGLSNFVASELHGYLSGRPDTDRGVPT